MQYVPPSNQELQDWTVDTRGVSVSVILLCVIVLELGCGCSFQYTRSVEENCLHSGNHNPCLIHTHRWTSVIQEQKNLPRTCFGSLCPPREGEPDSFHLPYLCYKYSDDHLYSHLTNCPLILTHLLK